MLIELLGVFVPVHLDVREKVMEHEPELTKVAPNLNMSLEHVGDWNESPYILANPG